MHPQLCAHVLDVCMHEKIPTYVSKHVTLLYSLLTRARFIVVEIRLINVINRACTNCCAFCGAAYMFTCMLLGLCCVVACAVLLLDLILNINLRKLEFTLSLYVRASRAPSLTAMVVHSTDRMSDSMSRDSDAAGSCSKRALRASTCGLRNLRGFGTEVMVAVAERISVIMPWPAALLTPGGVFLSDVCGGGRKGDSLGTGA